MLSRNYDEAITYWGAPVPDGEGGETFSAPVPLLGRWEDRNDEFNTATGETLISRSTVFVNQDLQIGGYLYRGTSVAASPTSVLEAQEIKAFIKVPSVRHNDYERRALCT